MQCRAVKSRYTRHSCVSDMLDQKFQRHWRRALIIPYITANIPNTPMEHGYKTQHSTVTALHTLNNTVAKGFNQRGNGKFSGNKIHRRERSRVFIYIGYWTLNIY